MSDAEAAALRGTEARSVSVGSSLLYEPPLAAAPLFLDPLRSQSYRGSVYVYVRETTDWRLRFSIRYGPPDDLPFARNVGRFLAALWKQADARFGTLCARLRERPLDVWLSRTGAAGGEHWHTSLYLTSVGEPRSGIEWAREIAHEYGHYLLPGASGYTSPESWANGVLGERLFLSWMLSDVRSARNTGEGLPFAVERDLDEYVAKQVTPLLDIAGGPSALPLADRGRSGFDAFTALMLDTDHVYGSRTILDLLEHLPAIRERPASGPDFRQALHDWLDAAPRFNTRVTGKDPRWCYLPAGKFRVVSGAISATGLVISGARVQRANGGWTVAVAKGGRCLISLSGAGGSATLTWTRR